MISFFPSRFLLFLCLLLSIVACQSNNESQDSSGDTTIAKVLSVTEFEQALQRHPNAQLIDVRTPEEVAQGAIENAVNYNFRDSDFGEQIKQLDPQKTTFVYCKSGGRSGKTTKLLKQAGFKEVYDLQGGYTAWRAAH